MSSITHETIIITTTREHAPALRQAAINIMGPDLVSNLVTARVNNCVSFFVAPDGSKEGAAEASEMSVRRKTLIEFLNKPEGPNFAEYALVRFGGGNPPGTSWRYAAEDDQVPIFQDQDRVEMAIDLALQRAPYDGDHHKMWVIDQMLRLLAGDRYEALVARTKSWDVGTPS